MNLVSERLVVVLVALSVLWCMRVSPHRNSSLTLRQMAHYGEGMDRTTGDKIALELRDQTHSARWLADQTDIPETTLRRKMKGTDGFTLGDLMAIATVLNVAPQSLLPDSLIAIATPGGTAS